MIKSITFVVGCCLVLNLRKGEWNELTGQPKDCGKNHPNLRTNSLQPGENDVDWRAFPTSLSTARLDGPQPESLV
jgi:hypothetical protein